jgi:hypothetical protein
LNTIYLFVDVYEIKNKEEFNNTHIIPNIIAIALIIFFNILFIFLFIIVRKYR